MDYEQTDTTAEPQDLADDWGDEPRKSADALKTEDVLDSLYGDEPEPEADPEPEPEPKPEQKPETAETDDDEAIWTTDDLELLRLVEPEYAAYQRDFQAFVQLKALGPERLANGDKAKAAAIQQQLQDAEAELRKRHEILTAAAQKFQAKAQAKQAQLLARRLEAEKRKLAERVPDLNKAALRSYLESRGFTKEEISMAADARLVELAEKARRYDELMAGKKPKKTRIPKRALKPKTPEADVIPLTNKKNTRRLPKAPGRNKPSEDAVTILYG